MTAPTPRRAAKPAPEGIAVSRPPPGELVTIPRQELQALVHDLRNHLNSMLMNGGVLAAHCRSNEKAAHHAALLEEDGDRCAQALRKLSDTYL
jgi:hypothetical protein